MEKTYTPSSIEAHWSQFWEQQKLATTKGTGQPYCIMLPPPNVTGTLHMGHGFQQTLMDALTRYQIMLGKKVLWQAGTDHAGIATQMVVERQLLQEGKTRHELGRESFIQRVWKWKEQSGSIITKQMRRMGTAIDWDRQCFTMDEKVTRSTYTAFIRLFEEGLIYRGQRLVNWDPQLHTAISDLEVTNKTEDGKLWYLRYPLADGSGSLTVATTRPETMLGDTAVAVHPEDERYAHLIGKMIALPLTDRQIPIIADANIDKEFGTGCVKVTPAHDFNDYEMGKRHQLPLINIFTKDAHLNDEVPTAYRGLERFVARKKVVADLDQQGLLEKIDPHTLNVPYGDRSGVVIEPMLTQQWFVNAKELAGPAIKVVEEGRLQFIPNNWSKTYLQWLENIEDWCISRQLWWGHRIPVWYDEAGKTYVGYDENDARQRSGLDAKTSLTQDNDVLDTWFSSALWPFATLGWPEQTVDLQDFYPSSVLVTGFDIIFFWVARMVMMGLKFMQDVPFREVYITGLIRDSHGQKMSKSKGNILDPIDIIDGISLEALVEKRTAGLMQPQMQAKIAENTRQEYPNGIGAHGTDALRFTFCALATTGRDINFDMNRIEGYRNFCNKIWNAARYVIMNTENQDCSATAMQLSTADRWIRSRLQQTISSVQQYFAQYRFDLIAQTVHEFIWNEYCDWYLELAKVTLNNPTSSAEQLRGTRNTLLTVLETTLRLLHPLMPFITEEIWHKVAAMLGIQSISVLQQPYPQVLKDQIDSQAEQQVEWLKQVITSIRNIRGEMNVSPAKQISILFSKGNTEDKHRVETGLAEIKFLARVQNIAWHAEESTLPASATALVDQLEIHIPLADLIDKDAEMQRLNKEIEKLKKEYDKSKVKLSNPSYVDKAPAAVVAKERENLAQLEQAMDQLKSHYQRIESM